MAACTPDRRSLNQRYGAALASGFGAAGGELILLLDADRQFHVAPD